MFNRSVGDNFAPNTLSICIQPNEGIHLTFEAKTPDSARETQSVDMDFRYSTAFGKALIPEAYERLLLDALHGDASLFTRSDEIEAMWQIIDPLLDAWQSEEAPPLTFYARKSWGPIEAEELLARDGHAWHLGCSDR
jgi:glucose-6-phosphate 1-dehydrogenase